MMKPALSIELVLIFFHMILEMIFSHTIFFLRACFFSRSPGFHLWRPTPLSRSLAIGLRLARGLWVWCTQPWPPFLDKPWEQMDFNCRFMDTDKFTDSHWFRGPLPKQQWHPSHRPPIPCWQPTGEQQFSILLVIQSLPTAPSACQILRQSSTMTSEPAGRYRRVEKTWSTASPSRLHYQWSQVRALSINSWTRPTQ